ncbi:MAG: cardiolipin synthase [Tannerellaceae bacterium]|jgi:cardiolipin synthase|nr:cardiolipin synthase [Tannerellaceae bacterium]
MLTGISLQAIVGSIIFILYSITISGLILVIITENRNPLKTIPWVVVLLMLPGLGLVFYFFFGQDNRKKRIISRRTHKRIMKLPQEGKKPPHDSCTVPEGYTPLVNLLGHNHQCPLLYGSDITIYTGGEDKFEALFEALEGARHHIHIQYYIFMDDQTGRRVRDLLVAKARAGVEVRLLYDDVGCWDVKKGFFRDMKAAGIEVYAFLKVAFPVLTSKVNYRNHRKIVVVDGKTGFMGGMNVADRYLKGNSLGKWRDTHFKFTGKGVYGLQSAFLIDWYVVSKKLLNDSVYYPPLPALGDNIMQILTSGPVGQWRTLLQAVIFIIANAKNYVYIQTPYFLPTEGLNQALQAAALGGVDVRLMLPKRSDTKAVNMASHSFIDDMVKAGARVFLYDMGFMHSKLVVSDDMLTCIGSANMDFRSFEHNFEITAFVYQGDFARQMKKIFLHDMQYCEKLVSSRWLKRPLRLRIAESFMRLFSPLL